MFLDTFVLRKPRGANFGDIIKVDGIVNKTFPRDSKKLKELKIIY